MSVDILGTSCDQCRSTVQYSFTSTETRKLVRTDSLGRPPRLSHSSWTMISCHGDDRFYIALFSALEQTRCAFIACDSEKVTVAFYCAFWICAELVCLQRCLVVCYMAGATWNCCHLDAGSVYTIQSCSMSPHFVQSHIRRYMRVYL